jgi:phosphatidate cytidylyltransferase
VTTPDHGGDRADGDVTAGKGGASNLTLRVASALALAPAVLAITYLGGWFFLILCAAAAVGILWEWTHLIGKADPGILAPGLAALLAALVLTGLGRPEAAGVAIVVGAALAGGMAGRPVYGARLDAGTWAAGGVIYAGIAFMSPALLRLDPGWGLTALLFLFATVWITDIFAFLCGRAIGGPLLWPRVSPKKTWSGAIGGLAGGVAAGVLVAYASGIGKLGMAGVVALLLSVLAQAGDLFESAVKRRFGAKDASRFIPGHGGLMDRLDGFLFAAFAALIIGILRQGTAAPARGFLLW